MRSAEPPSSSGSSGCSSSIAFCEALREAMPARLPRPMRASSCALRAGQSAGSARARTRRSNSAASCRVRLRVGIKAALPVAPARRRRRGGRPRPRAPRRESRRARRSQPSAARVAATSAAPSAAPCTSWVPALLGLPLPITVLQHTSVGSAAVLAGLRQRRLDGRQIVAGDVANDAPAVGLEAPRGVVGEPVLDVAVDADAVVVVDGDQLGEPERAGQRARPRG